MTHWNIVKVDHDGEKEIAHVLGVVSITRKDRPRPDDELAHQLGLVSADLHREHVLLALHGATAEIRATRHPLSPYLVVGKIYPRFEIDEEADPVEEVTGTNWADKKKATTDGEPPDNDDWNAAAPKPIDEHSGQHGAYFVLPEEERAKESVRPYRDTYKHLVCGTTTTMSRPIAETYQTQPGYYGRTFCASCKTHKPVGSKEAGGEFVWVDDGSYVGT